MTSQQRKIIKSYLDRWAESRGKAGHVGAPSLVGNMQVLQNNCLGGGDSSGSIPLDDRSVIIDRVVAIMKKIEPMAHDAMLVSHVDRHLTKLDLAKRFPNKNVLSNSRKTAYLMVFAALAVTQYATGIL